MSDIQLHEKCVDAWLRSRGRRDSDNTGAVKLLLVGLRALWDRAQPSLGEVTLAAIFQRAIHTAERRHEELAQLGLRVNERGAIDITSPTVPRVDLGDAVACVLVEILRVLDSLTAGALTPGLHATLAVPNGDELRRVERNANGSGLRPERVDP